MAVVIDAEEMVPGFEIKQTKASMSENLPRKPPDPLSSPRNHTQSPRCPEKLPENHRKTSRKKKTKTLEREPPPRPLEENPANHP